VVTCEAMLTKRELQEHWSLVEHYLPLVRTAAARMYARLAGQVELDDLISSGTIGMMGAIKSFDAGRGVKFETYCLPRVRGAMLDELRSMDWVPRLARAKHRRLVQATHAIEARAGRKPTCKEVAAELGVSEGEAARMLGSVDLMSQVSLDRPITRGVACDGRAGLECPLCDTLESHAYQDPGRRLLLRDMVGRIQRDLSKTERLVILLYYYEGMTMGEIGAALELSESRICQMHSAILARLRAGMDPADVLAA
jgi:RNA polymerase sigma factor FliA